jgi:thymidylate synthase ThyX
MIDDYEEFTESQLKVLKRYVTNTSGNVFVLRNLPEVIKGALFSRYSRSSLGLRSLLLKEFILNEETAFDSITGLTGSSEEQALDQMAAIKKAQNFYDRILDGYGDDSIGELGGAHLAIEQISMIAAKMIEDCRIGGSPLEKSTRYIYFDQKIKGDYLFYREPVLMTSAYREIYVDTCNMLFDTYSKFIPPLTAIMEQSFPKEENVSKASYAAAVRAKVLDCLRGLLPAGTLTNMGVFGNGRFYESLLHKLHCHNLAELQDIGKKAYTELSKVIPSFVRRSETQHRHHQAFAQFFETMRAEQRLVISEHLEKIPDHSNRSHGVYLIDSTPDAPARVAAALLYIDSQRSLNDLYKYCHALSDEEIGRILEAGCNARENRRHKSPRALEHAEFTFEIVSDFGVYRDLHRHRMLTQDRQLLTCRLDYFVPQEIEGTEMEKEYRQAMEQAKQVYDTIARELPEEAQYVVPMAYNIRWYFHINLRALQWLCELRSAPTGHPTYRYIAQEMSRQICQKIPAFERFFKFVDYNGHQLGRLGQEIRNEQKQRQRVLASS